MGTMDLKRYFIIGDEWIYFKLYSGVQTADRILQEAITPVVNHLILKKIIDHWFFIRYADPDLHLRIRLHLVKPRSIGSLVKTFYKYIEIFVQQDLIWKVQTDTYQREIERYGIYSMELSEWLFYIHSELFLEILPILKNQEGAIQRWHFALKSIDYFLDSFNFNLEDKVLFMGELKDDFRKEFGIDRNLKDQLNNKFAKEWKGLEKSLNSSTENESIISPLHIYLINFKNKATPIAEGIIKTCNNHQEYISINSLLSSHIHMMMNRMFRSKQRVYELVLYDFLYRYYKSTMARLQATKKENVTASLEKV
jgi:thiopeptide-type bacteriocin biosynthesis protein